MNVEKTRSQFEAKIMQPAESDDNEIWAFVVLPKDVSAKLPRRGRTSIDGNMNGASFRALLEPDGKKSHWLKIKPELLQASGQKIGDVSNFEIIAVEAEPEPEVPEDLRKALESCPGANATWKDTTTIARLDWVHWITTAKQAKTRAKRINDACDKLAKGEKRVCCFDPSGFYSKAFSAPKVDR